MSSDDTRPENLDPLSASEWPTVESESLLDPQLTSRDDQSIYHRTIPAPPDVDQILSGEYTGWVPIIRAGESLGDAQKRADATVHRIEKNLIDEDAPTQMTVSTVDGPRTTSEVLGSIGPEFVVTPAATGTSPMSSRVGDFVPDPDFVASPADALELARERIAQMREALQKSVAHVSRSFEHPIFQPETQPINNPPVSHSRVMPPLRQEVPPVQPVVPTVVPAAPVVEEPVTHYRVQEQTVEEELRPTPQFSVDQVQTQDHSLELVIMRDEIKDLRTRLDSSQKLIEDLMHRITNLAELALRGRQN